MKSYCQKQITITENYMNINLTEQVACSLFCGFYFNSCSLVHVQHVPDSPL